MSARTYQTIQRFDARDVRVPDVNPRAEIEVRQASLFQILWRRQWVVWCACVLAGILGVAYLFVTRPVYTSTARLYIERNGPRVLSDAQGSLAPSDNDLYTQCEVIRSVPIIQQALDTRAVDPNRLFGNAGKNPAEFIKAKLNVGVGKRDDIISISLDTYDPAAGATMVNSVVDAYRAFQTQMKRSSATEVLTLLEREKKQQDEQLDALLKQVVAFKQSNGEMFFTTERGTNIVNQNLAIISEQLTRARLVAAQLHVAHLDPNSNRVQSYALWQGAVKQADEYERVFEEEKRKALVVNAKQAEFQKLQLDVDRLSKICDLLDARIKELKVTEDAGVMNLHVLEQATVGSPTHPRKSMTLAVALALGVALGGGAALLIDRVDQRLRSPHEAREALGLPVLGVIPALPASAASGRLNCIVHFDPDHRFAEACRALRTAILYGRPHKGKQTILMTSPQRGDGKSVLSSNLAIAMAQAGQRTLLIDADLRRPVQHAAFQVSNEVGLADVVAGRVPIGQAVRDTMVDGLSLLTCGANPGSSAELFSSAAFGTLLAQLKEHYDLIVIDSPPVLAVSDARIIAAQADLTVLVMRADKSTRQGAEQACESLTNVGASLFGLVVNDVKYKRLSGYNAYVNDDPVATPETVVTSSYDTPARKQLIAAIARGLPDRAGGQ